MELFELVYVSLATRQMSSGDLTALMEQSAKNNSSSDISGMLVYHHREFMQILEGHAEDVLALYETICADERNERNYVMWRGPLATRAFADWSMAFVDGDALELNNRPAYSNFLQNGLVRLAADGEPSVGRQFLESVRDEFLRKR